MNNSSQLALNVRLNINSTFENFFCADLKANKIGLKALKRNQEKFIYLLGSSGSGVSHLLQAVCNDSNYKGERSVYIPLSEVSKEDPEIVFDGMDQFDCVCLDDLDAVIHRDNWQLEIFNLFNDFWGSGYRFSSTKEQPIINKKSIPNRSRTQTVNEADKLQNHGDQLCLSGHILNHRRYTD